MIPAHLELQAELRLTRQLLGDDTKEFDDVLRSISNAGPLDGGATIREERRMMRAALTRSGYYRTRQPVPLTQLHQELTLIERARGGGIDRQALGYAREALRLLGRSIEATGDPEPFSPPLQVQSIRRDFISLLTGQEVPALVHGEYCSDPTING